ncbi:MAG: endonuclease/exonuclease/phosphatase family protein [Bacteroidota bacterium]
MNAFTDFHLFDTTVDTIDRLGYVDPKNVPMHEFTLASQNVRSLLKNHQSVSSFLSTTNIKIVALQEVWHNGSTVFDNYQLNIQERLSKRGGGVGIAVHNSIDFSPCPSLSIMNHDIELIGIETKSFYFMSIYVPPQASFTNTAIHLRAALASLKKKAIFLAGDFNVNIMAHSPKSQQLLDLMIEFKMIPTIEIPTRITSKSCTLIDNIFSNYRDSITSGVLTTEISDHLTPYLNLGGLTQTESPRRISYRCMSRNNLTTLRSLLCAHDWFLPDDPANAFDHFHRLLQECLDIACPMITVPFNKNFHKIEPWMTKCLLISRREKKRLHRSFVLSHSELMEQKYKQYCRLYNILLRKAKILHWDQFYATFKNDLQKMWQVTNNLLGRTKKKNRFPSFFSVNSRKISNNSTVADQFNKFFANIGANLTSNPNFYGNSDYMEYMPLNNNHHFDFNYISTFELDKVISKLKNKSSAGFDHISNKCLKQIKQPLLFPLTYLINLSLRTGYIPVTYKRSKVFTSI